MNYPVQRTLLFFLLFFFTATVQAQTIHYVKAGGSGDGSSWAEASGNLRNTIINADEGNQVWVAEGTYTVPADNSFALRSGVEVYGGFPAAAENPDMDDRDWIEYETILSGNGERTTVANLGGVNRSTILDGFSIIDGNGINGGGISNAGSSPTLRNLIIRDNSASGRGGGIYNTGSSASPVIHNVVIHSNTANWGGGVFNAGDADPVIVNTTIRNNSSVVNGGGVYNESAGTVTLTNVVISENSTGNGNTAGAINNSNSTLFMTNSTVVNNSSDQTEDEKDISNIGDGELHIRNSIIYGNSSSVYSEDPALLTISYSLVQDYTAESNGNISGANIPLFVDASNGDYRLQDRSVVINQGSNSFYNLGQTPDLNQVVMDLDDNTRFYNNGTVDLGAYEYQGAPGTPFVIGPDAGGIIYVRSGGTGAGGDWNDALGDIQTAINGPAVTEVWVAEGMYELQTPLRMKNGVEIYGGFPDAGSPGFASRDWRQYETVLSGGGTSEVIENIFTSGDPLTDSAVLDGFTVRDGFATGSSNDRRGGGIYNLYASPVLRNLLITESEAYHGGGIANEHSSPVIRDLTISNNTSERWGGGIYNIDSSPNIFNVVMHENTALMGGAMFSLGSGSQPVVTNTTMVNNHSTGDSGHSLANNESAEVEVRNSILYTDEGTFSEVYNFGNIAEGDPGNVIFRNSVIRQSYNSGVWVTSYGEDEGGNTDAAPEFTDPDSLDFILQNISPAINAGSNSWYWDALGLGGAMPVNPDNPDWGPDLTGEPRIAWGTIDIGANEYQGALLPGAVVLLSPGAESSGVSLTPLLEWSASDEAEGYNIQIAKAASISAAPDFDSPVINEDVGDVTEFLVEEALDLFSAYHWRVRAYDEVGEGIWSEAGSFTTLNEVPPATYYVREGGVGDGSSWDEASGDLGTILLDTKVGDEVWVSEGTYVSPTSPRIGFYMRNGVAIYGGFPEHLADPGMDDRDWLAYPSVLDGENQREIIVYGGTDLTAVLDGFVITRGDAQRGGGINIGAGAPTLRNLIVENNHALWGGGIFLADGSEPALTNVIIRNNSSLYYAGGMFVGSGSDAVLTNVEISGNFTGADYAGGALFVDEGSTVTLTNGTISGNRSREFESGTGPPGVGDLMVIANSELGIRNSVIHGNSSGIHSDETSSVIRTHSLVQGYEEETNGNLRGSLSPFFADAENADYRPTNQSPLLNSGEDALFDPLEDPDLSEVTTDAVGNPRFFNGNRVDIGAYELQEPAGELLVITPDIDGVLYVKEDGTGAGDSWTDATSDLNTALTAPGVEEIWVAEGTYAPGQSLVMQPGVAIYGGFPATGSPVFGDRDWTQHPVILSGSDNRRVVSNIYSAENRLDDSAILDGFIIQDGYAYGPRSAGRGGGIYNYYASPVLTNLIIKENDAREGGGVFNSNSSPKLLYLTIENNTSELNGAGIYNEGGTPELTNVLIAGNSTENSGGGIASSENAEPVLTNVTITGNSASSGAGMVNSNGAEAFVRNSIIHDNRGFSEIYNHKNSVYPEFYGNVKFWNSIVSGSRPGEEFNPSIGDDEGGNLDIDPLFSDPTDNDYSLALQSPAINAGSEQLYWEMIGGGGAIPDVVDENAWGMDLSGNPRIKWGMIDMGAYESQSPPVPLIVGLTNPAHEAADIGLNPAFAWQTSQFAETYTFQISENDTFSSFVIDESGLASTEFEITEVNLELATTYFWRVRGENTSGSGSWSAVRSFETIPNVPDAIVLLSPEDEADEISLNPEFEWEEMDETDSYTLQISDTEEGFTDPVIEESEIEEAGYQANDAGLAYLTTYYWRVRGVNGTGNGEWSEVWSFTTSPEDITPTDNVVYVRVDGTGNGSGWDEATGDLQRAIDAVDVEQVWVAEGLYELSEGLQMKNDVLIYGGFADTGDPGLTSRDWNEFETVLTVTGSTSVIRNEFTGEEPLERSAILDGFTIRDAVNTGNGGGVYNNYASPTLRNLLITENEAYNGGGIYNNNSSPLIENVHIIENMASVGLGVYNEEADAEFHSVTIAANFSSANTLGGGMYNLSSTVTLTNSVIRDHQLSTAMLKSFGGGMFNENSVIIMTNVLLSGNQAYTGGGMLSDKASTRVYLTNVTVIENLSGDGGGHAFMTTDAAELHVRNSVVYGNGPDGNPENSVINGTTFFDPTGAGTLGKTLFSHSLVHGSFEEDGTTWVASYGINNSGNIDQDPGFTDPGEGDFTLTETSPAYKAGSTGYFEPGETPDLSEITTDLNGYTRFSIPGQVDLGTYEVQLAPVPGTVVLSSPEDEADLVAITPQLLWGEAAGADSYELQVSELQDFAEVVVGETSLIGTNFDVTEELEKGTTYYWRVRGVNGTGDGEWSEARSFTTSPEDITPTDNVVYVRVDGTGNGSGWDEATGDLQRAIDVVDVEQVWVAEGLYELPEGLQMKNDVLIYGGFADTGDPGLASRDWESFETVLTVTESTSVLRNEFTEEEPLEKSAILDGFTIRDAVNAGNGGGVYNEYASPTLRNLLITGNTALSGGGIYNTNSSPLIENVHIIENMASVGPGVYNEEAGAEFHWVTIAGNFSSANVLGGGMYNSSSTVTLINSVIRDHKLDTNMFSSFGGGMFNDNSVVIMTNVLLSGNQAYIGGAVLSNGASSRVYVTNVTATENLSGDGGGHAFLTTDGAELHVRNSVVYGNGPDGNPENSVINGTTFADPYAPGTTGVTFFSHSLIDGSFEEDGTTWVASYGINNSGNIDQDPGFTDPGEGDFTLTETSRAYKAGSTGYYEPGETPDLSAIVTDLNGYTRFAIPGQVDLGAYEMQLAPIPGAVVLSSPEDGAGAVEVTPQFIWEEAAGADSYELQISELQDFAEVVVGETSLIGTNFDVTEELEKGTTYYWRVRASNTGGNGVWSNVLSFTTLTTPATPVEDKSSEPGAPTNLTATPGDKLVELNWKAPAKDGGTDITRYRVQYSADGGGTWTNYTMEATTETGRTVTGLINNVAYLFRVAAVNRIGTGPFETSSGIVIPTAPVPDPENVTRFPDLEPGEIFIYVNGEPEVMILEVIDGEQLRLSKDGDEMFISLASLNIAGEKIPISSVDNVFRLLQNEEASIHLTGSGFEPGSYLAIWIFSDPQFLGHILVSEDGSFEEVVSIPADLESGFHTLQISGTDQSGGEVLMNAGIEISTLAVPENITPPEISGIKWSIEEEIALFPGEWTGSPEPVLSYRWMRCEVAGQDSEECSVIAGETEETYTIGQQDYGFYLRAAVSGNNGIGEPVDAVSAAVGPVGPGSADASSSTASVPSVGMAGEVSYITVHIKDAYDNPIPGDTGKLSVSVESGPNRGVIFSEIEETGEGIYQTGYLPVKGGSDQFSILFDGQPVGDSPYTSIVETMEFKLAQNYSNPFRSSTRFEYQVSVISDVSIVVYDLLGREVSTVVANPTHQPGKYVIEWNPDGLASGTYIYRMVAYGENEEQFMKDLMLTFIK